MASVISNCEYCGEVFLSTRKGHKYCSTLCSSTHYNRGKARISKAQRENKACIVCGENFKPHNINNIYCSKACNYKSRDDKRTTEYNMWRGAKSRAKKLGLPFNLTLEDINIPEVCPVLGIQLSPMKGRGAVNDNSPSLDKVIPELGYVRGNVNVISYRANRIKSNATYEEINMVAKYMGGCSL